VCRSAVEIEVILLDILAVIAFAAGQAKESLLENGIAPIPQRQRKTEALLVIGKASESIFSPSVRP
jgi:hypothetical protein